MEDILKRDELIAQFRWPEKKDRAFAAGTDRRLQAWPRWMPEHLRDTAVADGYYTLADLAIKSLEENPPARHVDKLFAPIAMLYRQFLELSMKSIIDDGMRLGILEKRDITDYGHGLHGLWSDSRRVAEELNRGADLTPVRAVERVIKEFQRIDKSGEEFRYAFRRDGTPSLGNAPETICLSNLRDVMEGVHNFFEGLGCQISLALDWQADMESEWGGAY